MLVFVAVVSWKMTFQVPWTLTPWNWARPVSPAVPTNGRFSVWSGFAQGGVAALQIPTDEFGDRVSGPTDWPPMVADVREQLDQSALRRDDIDVEIARRVGAVPARLEGDRDAIRADDLALELLAHAQGHVQLAIPGSPSRDVVRYRDVDGLRDDRRLVLRALLLRVGHAAQHEPDRHADRQSQKAGEREAGMLALHSRTTSPSGIDATSTSAPDLARAHSHAPARESPGFSDFNPRVSARVAGEYERAAGGGPPRLDPRRPTLALQGGWPDHSIAPAHRKR